MYLTVDPLNLALRGRLEEIFDSSRNEKIITYQVWFVQFFQKLIRSRASFG
ncbi:hypothetical protein VAE063_150014 [Vibrio aestuarianus]|uniref:Uncharacterized protein n=1 Tax=Vibrio aestuarianus TaxID=28171 RepID=A0ABM9FLT2_9VIBR|nr:hypothetical protein VAE063_150014 [Vibrio aestuarianus]